MLLRLRGEKDMTLKDKATMGPLDKFVKYNLFPWKLLVHVILLVACTVQVVTIVNGSSANSRAHTKIFYFWFLSQDGTYNEVDYDKFNYLFNIDSLIHKINDSVQTYFSLEDIPVELYELPKHNGTINDVRVMVQTGKKNFSDQPFSFYINPNNLAIFGLSAAELKKNLSNAVTIQIVYPINSVLPEYVSSVDCYNYTITQSYTLEEGNLVRLDIDIGEDICSRDINATWTSTLWINFVVCLMAAISLILSWKYVYNFYEMYSSFKQKYEKASLFNSTQLKSLLHSVYKRNEMFLEFTKFRSESATEMELDLDERSETGANAQVPSHKWEKVTMQEKRALFNFWNVLSIIGNTLQISGSMLYLFNRSENLAVINFLNGLGCMLAWINITRYFEYSPTYYVVYSTFRVSLPLITKYLLAILPIYIGFGLLGACLFYGSERFTSLGRSMFTLFALMNGDMVFDTFNDITALSCICAQIFIYIFCLLFIWLTNNIVWC